MQWSLFLLPLVGQSFFSTCQLYEYHFIRNETTWADARTYCRQHYTDLASVFDMANMKELCESTSDESEAWIGLFNNTGGDNRVSHWSLPGVKYSENQSRWKHSEPNDITHPENCVANIQEWADITCKRDMQFICFDENNKTGKTIILIKENLNWTQAQNYCREHYTDLASGLDQVDGKEFKKVKNSPPMWIGLFRDSWMWSDGSNFSFRYWDMELFNDAEISGACAVTLLGRSGRWRSDECNRKKPFFCYHDKLILIKENKTWEEALDHCRENYGNLVSITDRHQQRAVEAKAERASSRYVWLGLRYSCALDLWFWISDSAVCYDHWAADGKTRGVRGLQLWPEEDRTSGSVKETVRDLISFVPHSELQVNECGKK